MNTNQYTNGRDHMDLEAAPELSMPTPKASPTTQPIDYSKMISIINTWVDILNARLLAVMALIGALVIFGYAVYDPTNLRLTAGSLYSVGVLWPVMWLFMRKG